MCSCSRTGRRPAPLSIEYAAHRGLLPCAWRASNCERSWTTSGNGGSSVGVAGRRLHPCVRPVLAFGDVDHAERVAELKRSVLEGEGATPRIFRTAAYTGDDVPESWDGYVAKVRAQSFRVTDEDIERLLAMGRTEDEIFEMTVAAALGAAARGLEVGLRALSEVD